MWSPDGGRIAYMSDRDGDPEIYVHDLGTGRVERLTHNTSDDTSPVWSPDGDRIAYESDRDGDPEIYVHDLGTGDVERLTDNTSDDTSPVWSPDGGRIAYLSDWQVVIHDLGTGRVEQITNTGWGAWCPVWDPDGGRIAYMRYGVGLREAIFVYDLITGDAEQITDISINEDWCPVWSPSGGRIVDTSNPAGDTETGGVEIHDEDVSAGRVEQMPEEPEEIGRFYAERYSATRAELGFVFEGRISRSGEKRSYVVEVPPGGSYDTITTLGSTDVWIEVYELSGISGEYLVASDDDSGSGSNALIGIRLDPGWYRIDVHGYEEETGDYTLLIGGPSDPLEGKFVSVVVSATSEAAALRAQDDLQRQYGLDFGILLSSDYLSLRPGYWVVYLGPFDTPEESQDGCWSALNKRTGNLCYGRRLSQNPADVEVVYPPARR